MVVARAGGQDYDSLTEYSVFVVITDDEGPPNLNPQAQKVDFKTVDLTKPVITLLGDATVYMDTMVDEADVLLGYNEYVNAGATADDTNAAGGGGMNLDGSGGTNATANITVLNPVNPKLPARYTITYNVADASGNQADEVTRTVIVRGKWGPEVRGTANDINDVVPTANGGTCCRWYKSCEIENVAFQCTQAEIDACAAVGQYFRDAKCNLCLQCDGYSGLDRKKIVSTKPADSSTDSLGREACIPSQEASVDRPAEPAEHRRHGLAGALLEHSQVDPGPGLLEPRDAQVGRVLQGGLHLHPELAPNHRELFLEKNFEQRQSHHTIRNGGFRHHAYGQFR